MKIIDGISIKRGAFLHAGLVALLITAAQPTQASKQYSVNNESVPEPLYMVQQKLQGLLASGDFAEAELITEELVVKFPQFAASHFLRAFVLDRANKNEAALKEAEVAARMNPGFCDSWLLLGSLRYVTGRLPTALEAYKSFIRLAPSDHPQRKTVEDAIVMLESAISKRGVGSTIDASAKTYLSLITANGVIRWSEKRMPLKIHIADGRGVIGYQEIFPKVLEESFREWSNAAAGVVSFEFVAEPSRADIKCLWTDDPARLAIPGEGGHTQYAVKSDGMVDGEIVILTARGKETVDINTLRYICLHEIGHALGLHGHSNNPQDIMFLATKTRRSDRPELSRRDVDTLKALYKLAPTELALDSLPSSIDTPIAKAAALNNQGNKLMQTKSYQAAIDKYREALDVRPGYELAEQNLAVALCNSTVELINRGKPADLEKAEKILKEAIAIQEKAQSKENLLVSLGNYRAILQRMKRDSEVATLENRIEKLKSGVR